MVQAKYIPVLPLAAFVRCFWYWEGVALEHSQERLMPTGEPTIIFQLHEERVRVYDWRDPTRFESIGHSILCGPRSEPFVLTPRRRIVSSVSSFARAARFPFSVHRAGNLKIAMSISLCSGVERPGNCASSYWNRAV